MLLVEGKKKKNATFASTKFFFLLNYLRKSTPTKVHTLPLLLSRKMSMTESSYGSGAQRGRDNRDQDDRKYTNRGDNRDDDDDDTRNTSYSKQRPRYDNRDRYRERDQRRNDNDRSSRRSGHESSSSRHQSDSRDRSQSPPLQGHVHSRKNLKDFSKRRPNTSSNNERRIRPTHISQKQKRSEEEKTMKWVADEDSFVLKQMKHGAVIRIKEGRSRPVDWIAANLRLIDGDPSVYDADFDAEDVDFEIPVPHAVIESLDLQSTTELEEDLLKYIKLDRHPRNAEFWEMMLILCQERKTMLQKRESWSGGADEPTQRLNPEDEMVRPVSEDIDAVLKGKTYDQLIGLEKKVTEMKDSDDPSVDVDFWTRLLKELVVRKAKAKLNQIHEDVVNERLRRLKKQQLAEALRAELQISQLLSKGTRQATNKVLYSSSMDTIEEAAYENNQAVIKQLRSQEDAHIQQTAVKDFLSNLEKSRDTVKKLVFLPMKSRPKDIQTRLVVSEFSEDKRMSMMSMPTASISAPAQYNDDQLVNEDEEMLNDEDSMVPVASDENSDLQKPRFYNRVVLGYEWNRYNQTHYSSENPPPKVVQGYKFNIFYPDLIDSRQTPTFSIIRDTRKTSKQLAIASGQNDTCTIKFHAGMPYQDIAFKIVDRQWDNSPHRGSRCKFENGVLQVHFKFKRVFYRK